MSYSMTQQYNIANDEKLHGDDENLIKTTMFILQLAWQFNSEEEDEEVFYLVHLKGANVKSNSYHAPFSVRVTAVLTTIMKINSAHQWIRTLLFYSLAVFRLKRTCNLEFKLYLFYNDYETSYTTYIKHARWHRCLCSGGHRVGGNRSTRRKPTCLTCWPHFHFTWCNVYY